jgi:hypothetical protein
MASREHTESRGRIRSVIAAALVLPALRVSAAGASPPPEVAAPAMALLASSASPHTVPRH